MKLSLINNLESHKPWYEGHEYDRYHNVLDQVQQADGYDFRTFWLVEHHFLSEYSHSSAPETFLAAVAERTDQIRLGHGVVVLPVNHPVRVAERVATLDILSNGRVDFGTGKGATDLEIEGFGIDRPEARERYDEAVHLLPKLLSADEPVRFEGEFWSLPEREIHPSPVQKPHPPFYRAAVSDSTWYETGRAGMGAVGLPLLTDPDRAAELINRYEKGVEEQDPIVEETTERTSILLFGLCASTYEKARDTIAEGIVDYINLSLTLFSPFGEDLVEGDLSSVPESFQWYGERLREGAGEDELYDELFERNMILGGTPGDFLETLKAFESTGVDEMILDMGPTPHRAAQRSIELIGKDVIPYL